MPSRFNSRGEELFPVIYDLMARFSIDALEVAIDDAVYELFELSDEEREVVEEYLEVF